MRKEDVEQSDNDITFGKFNDCIEINTIKNAIKIINESDLDLNLKYGIFNRLEDINLGIEHCHTIEKFIDLL